MGLNKHSPISSGILIKSRVSNAAGRRAPGCK
nr:MAG TPA: hypothetical protein [Caudoviricetes sp.]